MNLNQLKYIVAIDNFRSFSKAAEYCQIAQSTLSKEVQKLESQYGIMLFDRSRIPVVPTIKGEDLIHIAKKILDDFDHFESIAKIKDNKTLQGRFVLGIHPGIAPYLLPLFLIPFAQKHPLLKIKVLEVDQKQMDEQLTTGQLDGGIIIHPFFKGGYYESKIFDEPFVLYMDVKNPLRKLQTIKPEDIPFDELLLHEDIRNELLSNLYTERGNSPKKIVNVTYQSGSLETIRKIIDLHQGITFLPQLACLYMGERRKQQTVPIASDDFKRTISFISPRGFQKNRIIKALITELKDQVSQKLNNS